jgi:hypothetical protein
MWGLRFGHVIGLALVAGAFAMLCNPDPRYAHIPAYQESSGSGAAMLIILGVLMFLAASDDR